MLYGESNRLTDSFTVFPSEALRGELTVPGDKVANVHLVLATIACAGTTTEIQNPNYCGDVVEALNVLGDLGLITSTNNDKST